MIFYLVSLTLLFFGHFILIPMAKVLSYRLKGFHTYFYPIQGKLKIWSDGLKAQGDMFAEAKEFRQKFPDHKISITNLGTKTLISLRDPEYMKEFMQKPHYYEKAIIKDFFQPLMGDGLAMSEGETWKRHRKIISNSFHYDSLNKNISTIQTTAREFFDKIASQEYQNYSVINRVQQITGEIVGRIFFGEHLNKYTHEGKPLTLALADLISDLTSLAMTPLSVCLGGLALKYPVFPRYIKMKKRIKEFHAFCLKIIDDRKKSDQKGNDLLAALLATQNTSDAEAMLSDREIVDEFITFFTAGMDTTGHLIGMTLYCLVQNPKYLEVLRQEREEFYKHEKKLMTENLNKMEQLHNLIKETLRHYTPAPLLFIRKTVISHKILDLDVSKGTWIIPEPISISNDPKYFEEPEKFNPERWKEIGNKIDPYVFVPFSGGPRNCIGQHLAIAEAKVIISEFLERFDFKVKEGYDLKMVLRFLYEPEQEMLFELNKK